VQTCRSRPSEARFGGKVYGAERADGERPDSRRPGAENNGVSATDPGDGNRLIFKPSPLARLKTTAPGEAREAAPAAAGPLDVTAVPLTAAQAAQAAEAASPAPPAPRPPRPDRDDHTTISFEPLATLPPAGEAPKPEAPAQAETPDRTWLSLLVALAAAALLYYLYSQGLLR
jgi:hypothetical protein